MIYYSLYCSWKFLKFLMQQFLQIIILIGEHIHFAWKVWCIPVILIFIWSIQYVLLSIMFNLLHRFRSMNQELLENHHLCNRCNQCNVKIQIISITQRKPPCVTTKFTLFRSAKMNGTQRRTLASPWKMHFTYCSMLKGTSHAEVKLNSKKPSL